MKKLIKISGIIFIVLVFIQALFVMLVVILSYYKIVINFHIFKLIFKYILYTTEIDLLVCFLLYTLYTSYQICIEYKSKKNKLKK